MKLFKFQLEYYSQILVGNPGKFDIHPLENLIASTAISQPIHIWDFDSNTKASYRGIDLSVKFY